MARRKLNLKEKLFGFDGKELTKEKNNPNNKDEKEEKQTFKGVLIRHIQLAGQLDIKDQEKDDLYIAGMLIGPEEESAVLITSQYDALLKIVTQNSVKVRDAMGKENKTILFGLETNGAVKKALEESEVVKEEVKAKPKEETDEKK